MHLLIKRQVDPKVVEQSKVEIALSKYIINMKNEQISKLEKRREAIVNHEPLESSDPKMTAESFDGKDLDLTTVAGVDEGIKITKEGITRRVGMINNMGQKAGLTQEEVNAIEANSSRIRQENQSIDFKPSEVVTTGDSSGQQNTSSPLPTNSTNITSKAIESQSNQSDGTAQLGMILGISVVVIFFLIIFGYILYKRYKTFTSHKKIENLSNNIVQKIEEFQSPSSVRDTLVSVQHSENITEYERSYASFTQWPTPIDSNSF